MNEDQAKALREPFPPGAVGKLPKPYRADSQKGNCRECGGYHGLPAVHLDYVGHAATTDRLLKVDPSWSWEPFAVGPDGLPLVDRNGGLWIRLTVCGVTRIGYGDAGGKGGANAVKEAIGDALRNAAMRFGVALDLWAKEDLHAADVERGTAPGEPAAEETQRRELAKRRGQMFAALEESGIFQGDPRTEEGRRVRLGYVSRVLGREVISTNDMTVEEASKVVDAVRADAKDLAGGAK